MNCKKVTNIDMNSEQMKKRSELRKHVVWMASSRKDVLSFPVDVKKDLGHALRDVQAGRNSENIKLLKHIGSGVYQISTDDITGTFRLVYLLEFEDCIVVLHAFQKKSKTGIETPKKEIDVIKERMKAAKGAYQKWKESL